MSTKLLSESPHRSNEGRLPNSMGVGPLAIDCDMALAHGWTVEQIDVAAHVLAELSRANNKVVALRRGHTRQCPVCECWTFPAGPCHLCHPHGKPVRCE